MTAIIRRRKGYCKYYLLLLVVTDDTVNLINTGYERRVFEIFETCDVNPFALRGFDRSISNRTKKVFTAIVPLQRKQ